MEVDMELSKKTTILLPPDLHEQLTRRAEREGTSLGELVRRACRTEYGYHSREDRRRALDELASLRLPVAEPARIKRESVPAAEDLMAGDLPRGRTERRTAGR
jgi:hypothetical protein